MKKILSLFLAITILGSMFCGITVSAEDANWTDGFTATMGSPKIEKGKITLEDATVDGASVAVRKPLTFPNGDIDVEWTMAYEKGANCNIQIRVGTHRYYFDAYTTKINYMPDTWSSQPNRWKGFKFDFGREYHDYHLIGKNGNAELYVDGYYLGAMSVDTASGDVSVNFYAGATATQPHIKLVVTNFKQNQPKGNSGDSDGSEIVNPNDQPVVPIYEEFDKDEGLWKNETKDAWKIEDGMLTVNNLNESGAQNYLRLQRYVGYADDFNFHTRMRAASENWMGSILFKIPGKWLMIYKNRDVWNIVNSQSNERPYYSTIHEGGKWFDIEVKTYNNCEGARIYINNDLLVDIPIGQKSLEAGPTEIRYTASAYNLCKSSDIYVDFMHFEPYYNNIEITKIKSGDAFLEGSKIKVGANFTGKNAPEEIEYLINGVPVAKGAAPYYEAELTGMPEGDYEVTARSESGERGIAKRFHVVKAIRAETKADKTKNGYKISTKLNDELNQVTAIEYLLNGKLIGTKTQAPYSINLDNISNKRHTLTTICKNKGDVTLAEYVTILDADVSGTRASEHFANDISYNVTGTNGSATYDFANGNYRLFIKHTPEGITYLTNNGEETYKFGTGKFDIFTNGAYANVYRNGQLAFSLIMPRTEDVFKKISNNGMKISDERVLIPENQRTYFVYEKIGAGKHIYNVSDMPYYYNFNFTAKKSDEMSIAINDEYFRTDVEIKNGEITVWDYLQGYQDTPRELILCDVPDISGDISYRLETSAGMARLYANEKFLGTFRCGRSAGGQSIGIELFGNSTIKDVEMNDNNDLSIYTYNSNIEGEFPAEEFFLQGSEVKFDKEKGIVLEAKKDEEKAAEIHAYAGDATLTADVTIEELKGGFWFSIDHATEKNYTKIGYNVATGNFEVIDIVDGIPTTTFTQEGSLPVGKKFNFELTTKQNESGKDIIMYVNGVQMFKHSKTLYVRGPLGFRITDGKATINNVVYKGDVRPVRGTRMIDVDTMVEPTWSVSEYEGKITFHSPSKGKAVTTDGAKTFTLEPWVEGDSFNVYQFFDENGEPTTELLSLVSGAHLRKTPSTIYDEKGLPYSNAFAYRSYDLGKTWIDEGFIVKEDTVLPDDVDVRMDGMVRYFATGRYSGLYQGKSGRLYSTFGFAYSENDGSALVGYSDDKGKTWEFSETHLTKENTGLLLQESLVTELANGVVRVYSRSQAGSIVYFDSHDGGKTFETTYHTTPFLAALNCFQIQADPYDANTLYACWSYDNINLGPIMQYPRTRICLARSTDCGETWEFLGTYQQNISSSVASNTNLTMPTTKNYMFPSGWIDYGYSNPQDDGALAVVVDKSKLQGTKNFERVHLVGNDIVKNTAKVDTSKMLIIDSEEGNVWKSGKLHQNMACEGFISAEIAASYAGMKATYNNDGSVSFVLGTAEIIFGKEFVKYVDGKKYISLDEYIKKFNLASSIKGNVIIIDAYDDWNELKECTARYSVDIFDTKTNDETEAK